MSVRTSQQIGFRALGRDGSYIRSMRCHGLPGRHCLSNSCSVQLPLVLGYRTRGKQTVYYQTPPGVLRATQYGAFGAALYLPGLNPGVSREF